MIHLHISKQMIAKWMCSSFMRNWVLQSMENQPQLQERIFQSSFKIKGARSSVASTWLRLTQQPRYTLSGTCTTPSMEVYYGLPSNYFFVHAVTDLGSPHMYYGASVGVHANGFLRVLNGSAVTRLKSFRKLNFAIPMSKVNTAVVGSCWNSQYTWGVKFTLDMTSIVSLKEAWSSLEILLLVPGGSDIGTKLELRWRKGVRGLKD